MKGHEFMERHLPVRSALLVGVAVCLVAITVALLLRSATSATAGTAPPRHHPLGAAAPSRALLRSRRIPTSPRLANAFGVFRHRQLLRTAQAGDGVASSPGLQPITTRMANRLTAPGGPTAEYGLNPSLTQEVAVNPSLHVWLVPGSEGVCVIQPLQMETGQPVLGAYATGCGSVATASAGGFWGVAGDQGGEQTLVGLAPDGNSTVSVMDAEGSDQRVPVVDNVYVAKGVDLKTVAVRDVAGAVRTFRLKAG
jgi:hypothetical protein